MDKLLLSLHVLAAIVFVGPVTVAVSLFPRYAGEALAAGRTTGVVALLHRISRVYAVLGLSVPVLGIALATRLKVLGDVWVVVSLVLTLAAALLLAVVLFGVRLTPSGVSAGVRVVLKAGTYVLTLPRRCHACMDGSLAY